MLQSAALRVLSSVTRSEPPPPGANLPTDLDGFHRVVLVQLVDVVGDAGVERGG